MTLDPTLTRRAALVGGLLAAPSLAAAQSTRPATVPTAGRQGAGFYRTSAGGLDVTLVTDGGFTLAPLHPALGMDQPAETVMAVARQYHVAEEMPAHVHCLLVRSPDGLVLVDAGCGKTFGAGAGRLVEFLANAGVTPDQIDAVVLTHAHLDHVGGLVGGLPEAGGEPTFPNATVFVTDAERDFWLDEANPFRKPGAGEMANVTAAVAANALNGVRGKLDTMGERKAPARGVEVVPLPGHTPGHVGLRVGTGDDALTYVGDTLMFLPLLAAHPEWHVAFDADPVAGAATRGRLFADLARNGTRLAGPHVPFPGFGRLRRRDLGEAGGYEFLPETWRWTPGA